MSEQLAELQVQLQLQTSSFEAGVKSMDRQLKRVEKNTARTSKKFQKFGSDIAKIGAGIAAAFSVKAIKGVIETNSELAKIARTVGLTAEQYQELEFAASQAGVSTSQFNSNMTAFVKRVGEAGAGMGPLVTGLKKLNPELLEAITNAKSQKEAFDILSDGIANAASATEKAAIANAAFGRSGITMVELARDGAAGLELQAQKARELGLVIENELIAKAEIYDDKLDQLSRRIKATFGSTVIDSISKTIDFLEDLLPATVIGFAVLFEKIATELQVFFIRAGAVILEVLNALRLPVKKLLEGMAALGSTSAEDALKYWPEAGEVWEANAAKVKALRLETEDYIRRLEDVAVAEIAANRAARKAAEDAIKAKTEASNSFLTGGSTAPNAPVPAPDLSEWEKAFKKLWDEDANPMNEMAERLGLLNAALDKAFAEGDTGRIDQIYKMIEAIEFGVEKTDDLGAKVVSIGEEIKNSIDGFVSDFTDSLVDGLLEGELAFDDFAKNVLATIAKLALNKVFTQFFDVVLGSIGLGGGTGATASPVTPTGNTRAMDAMASPMIVGTPMGAAMPSMSGSNSPVTVNVINQSSNNVEVKEKKTSRGIEIDVLINKTVNQGFASGAFDSAMQTNFGNRRLGY